MHNDDQLDPLEGKGEDMVPEEGIPFDDIDEDTPASAVQPVPGNEAPEDISEGQVDPEETAGPTGDLEPEVDAFPTDSPQPADEPSAQVEESGETLRLSEGEEDHGMDTGAEGIPTEEDDHGMSAGYPPVRDEDLPPDPGEAEEELQKPEAEDIRGAPLFSPEALDEDLAVITPAPVQPKPIEADPEMLELLVKDEDLLKLWLRANQAQINVNDELRNIEISRQMLNQIQYGRNEILAGRDHFEEAERHINEVDLRIQLNRSVRAKTRRPGWWLFIYQIITGILLLGLLIGVFGQYALAGAKEIDAVSPEVTAEPQETEALGTETEEEADVGASDDEMQDEDLSISERVAQLGPDMVYLLVTMIWAGIGGVVGAIFSLVQHIAQDQDFDDQHNMWYVGSPWMGIFAGAATFLILRTGMLSLLESSADISSPIIIYVFGFLVGFRHNVFTELVRRLINTIRFEEETEPTPPPEPTKKPKVTTPPPVLVLEDESSPEEEEQP